MNLLAQDHALKRRAAALPSDEELAAARARGDAAFLWAYVDRATTLLEDLKTQVAGLKNPEPIPVPAMPSSLSGGARIRGYAARWGLLGNELTMPGFFGDVQAAVDAGVPITWAHDTRHTLGRVTESYEDGLGLYIVAELLPPVESWQQTIHAALLAGLVTGMSYFAAIRQEPVRAARLLEVCVTRYPGNPESRILAVEPL